MIRKQLLILVFMVLVSSIAFAYSDFVVVKNYPKHNDMWNWDGLFVAPNIIMINGYENQHQYNNILVHEYTHYLCYTLFGNIDINHERCFTDEYNEGTSIYEK